MASIRKLRGKWQVQIRRSGQKPLTRSFSKKADATRWATAKEAELDSAERPSDVVLLATTTLGDLMERYRDTVSPTKRSGFQETYRLNRLLHHSISKLTLDRLTTGAFASFRDERLKKVGRQQVRHDLNAFGVVLKAAKLDWDFPLVRIPLDDLRKPAQPPARDRRLLDGEYELLKEAALSGNTPYVWAVIEFALETAMRRSEILGLEWRYIDFTRRIAHLPVTKNGQPRDVPMTSTAVMVLRSQQEKKLPRPFPHSSSALRNAWDKTLKRSDVSDLHFHDLRHEAISRLFEKGLSIPKETRC